LVFTRNKGASLFDDNGRIFCPPGLTKKRPFISSEAANLILKKIDRYNIFVKGDRKILEEIIKTPHKSQQSPPPPITPNSNTANPSPARPPTAQKTTPE